MRVLVANKFWYRRGGLESVMLDEIRALEGAGHQVAHFSTAHPENDPSAWSEYFAPYLELGEAGSGMSAPQKALAATRLFHNREAARRFDALIEAFEPDVIHVHGIHRHLSMSILMVAKRRNVPVVQSLHDAHMVCPSGVLLRGDGTACLPRQCGRGSFTQAIAGRCVHGSAAQSALGAAQAGYDQWACTRNALVTRFTSPSRFIADLMRDGGWNEPIDYVPNAVEARVPQASLGKDCLVLSRLSEEKGVRLALQAARDAGIALTVAGDGPLRSELEGAHPEARFLGRVDAARAQRLLEGARCVIVPSVCPENAPMSVLEAMALGVPVIASRIGGIPEMVTHGEDGYLVQPGDVDDLSRAMGHLAADEELARRLGAAANETVRARFSPERHLTGLLESYRQAMLSAR